jgi:hypothetical protein
VNLFLSICASLVVAGIAALVYFAVRIWNYKSDGSANYAGVDFRPTIGFTHMDGWASLALLMVNKSEWNVWAEEIEIALTDLIADDQTSEPTYREIQKIRQTVQPRDMLPISLMETIYRAAGKPQTSYSCVMSTVIRYRVGEKWFERPLQPYKLKLAGLTVVSNHRERWTKSEFKPQEKSPDSQPVSTKSK